jgi:uncharacterized membrane protein
MSILKPVNVEQEALPISKTPGVGRLWRARWGAAVALLAMVLFIAWFASLAVANHQAWLTSGYDLGNADQALWNTAHGRPLVFTNWLGKDDWFLEPTRLAMHVEPIYLLLAPLYWIWEDVRALLILQAVIVALGAVPAYRLARRVLDSEAAGAVFAVVYLLSIGVHWQVLNDFHAVSLAAPFLLFAFDFLVEGRDWGFALFAVLAMMTKENIPLAVAGMGAWSSLVQKRRRLGLVTIVVALTWFLLAVFAVIPAFSKVGGSPFLTYYEQLPGSELVWAVLTNLFGPTALRYYVDYLLPLVFLPLLSPLALLPALPDLAINLLSDNPAMHVYGRQYVAALVPTGVVAAVMGMATLWRWIRSQHPQLLKAVQAGSLVVLLLLSFWATFSFPVTPWTGFRWPQMIDIKAKLSQFAVLIPDNASVCAPNNLNPHFSQRERIHLLPYTLECEYVILHVPSAPFLGSNESGANDTWRQRLLEQGDFGVVAAEDGMLLLRRGEANQALPPGFYRFALPGEVAPEVARAGQFGDAIDFLGYAVKPRSGALPSFHLYFRAAKALEQDYFLRLYLVEEPGQLVGASEHAQPTLVWYPTSRWQPGEIVEVVANTMDWGLDLDPNRDYALAFGWDDGSDAWDSGARLAYRDDGDAVAPRRFQGDTLVYLASVDAFGDAQVAMRRGQLPPGAEPLGGKLEPGVTLSGYRLQAAQGAEQPRPGDMLRLHLYWQVEADVARDYAVFVHLLDETGGLVAQGDNQPLGGSWPTSRWRVGDLVTDYYMVPLPTTLAPGEYTLAVGMYDPADGTRVGVSGTGADAAQQRLLIPLVVGRK